LLAHLELFTSKEIFGRSTPRGKSISSTQYNMCTCSEIGKIERDFFKIIQHILYFHFPLWIGDFINIVFTGLHQLWENPRNQFFKCSFFSFPLIC
jgi:hypothetical protein